MQADSLPSEPLGKPSLAFSWGLFCGSQTRAHLTESEDIFWNHIMGGDTWHLVDKRSGMLLNILTPVTKNYLTQNALIA